MTHFTVLVVGDDYEEVLEPYNENTRVKPYVDLTAEQVQERFESAKESMKERLEKDPEYKMTDFIQKTLLMEKVDAKWWKEWCGQSLDKEGNSLSTYNPESKWDWYQLGGRWSGVFPLKNGAQGKLGSPGVFGNKPENGRVDQCRIGDVDWEVLNQEAAERAGTEWDSLFKPYDPKTCWFKEEWVKEQQEKHLKIYGTREEYVRRRGIWTPYAFVSNQHGWIAPGEMGWFGMSSDETEDREDFCTELPKLLAQFSEDTIISCVDCHI